MQVMVMAVNGSVVLLSKAYELFHMTLLFRTHSLSKLPCDGVLKRPPSYISHGCRFWLSLTAGSLLVTVVFGAFVSASVVASLALIALTRSAGASFINSSGALRPGIVVAAAEAPSGVLSPWSLSSLLSSLPNHEWRRPPV
jgi:hypothetical protein